jgi:ribosomal protein S12 methylthiotransferase
MDNNRASFTSRVTSPPTYHLISLGCSKNTVDSASMALMLAGSGYRSVDEPSKASVVIVNTCGFIERARQESLHVLGELAAHKRKGQMLIATGCLTQRYGAEVSRQVPGIDGILGARHWMDIVSVVRQLRGETSPEPLYDLPVKSSLEREMPARIDSTSIERVAIQGASAYLKIADGCRRPCAFCAIPLIKGTAVSRPMPEILNEARLLEERGMHEVVLIAQDTTDYGYDLGMKDGLVVLLEQLVRAAPGIDWIRILYAYPGFVTDRLIEVMAEHSQIVPYLDMPLQHAHPDTLRRMKRPARMDWVYRTLEKMRLALPGLALRTTFIVGYPGETEEEFQTLFDFVAQIRFDRLGVFQFSFEAGVASEVLGDPVPSEVKEQRYQRLMELQQAISLEKNQEFIGRTLNVLVEGRGDGISLGRSYRDAPEIDGLVIIEQDLPAGIMAPVRITGALTYDLSGTVETRYHK